MNEDRDGLMQIGVRMAPEVKDKLVRLAGEYDQSIAGMVRLMTLYFDEVKPTVSLRYAPKGVPMDFVVREPA